MKVYHKNSCITCKNIISDIKKTKKDIEQRDFFKEPFSESELRHIIEAAGSTPRDMLRTRDKAYKELGFEHKKYTDSQIIKLMVKNPGLIRRPIIIVKDKAFVGKIDTKTL